MSNEVYSMPKNGSSYETVMSQVRELRGQMTPRSKRQACEYYFSGIGGNVQTYA